MPEMLGSALKISQDALEQDSPRQNSYRFKS